MDCNLPGFPIANMTLTFSGPTLPDVPRQPFRTGCRDESWHDDADPVIGRHPLPATARLRHRHRRRGVGGALLSRMIGG